MAKLTLTINLDNDAFQPDAAPEIARLLRGAADYVERRGADVIQCGRVAGLHDINGNLVGSYTITRCR